MAGVVESARFTNTEGVPEELAGYRGLGESERHELYGFDAEGNPTRLRDAAGLLIKFALESGKATDLSTRTSSPELAHILRTLDKISARLETLEAGDGTKADAKVDPD